MSLFDASAFDESTFAVDDSETATQSAFRVGGYPLRMPPKLLPEDEEAIPIMVLALMDEIW